MPKMLDLEMSDEAYSRLVSQGRDPVVEKQCERLLASSGLPLRQARWLAGLPITKFVWYFFQSPLLTVRQRRHRRVWEVYNREKCP